LGVLLSGRGSNFQAIHQAIVSGALAPAEVAIVISNRSAAPGLAYAESHGIPTAFVSAKAFDGLPAYDQEVLFHLQQAQVDVVVLAGYTKLLSHVLLSAYPGRIVNIHPSLLPAYGGMGMVGMKVHEAVVAAGETTSGCTVHLVTEEVDGGPILGQASVTVSPTDTPETLAAKVLTEEHRLYPQVLQRLINEIIANNQPGGAAVLCSDL
jgi:formyltetrahydrofolate-dependent phosphoribosylglycinamide formyltransferase